MQTSAVPLSLSTLCAHLCSDVTVARASSLLPCSKLFCGQSHRLFSLSIILRPCQTGSLVLAGPCDERGGSVSWSASWHYVGSLVYLSFHFCPQDREPLRTIFLKDVLKTRECLVKSG